MDITCVSEKEKGAETYLKVIAKTLLTWERNICLGSGSIESTKQDKAKDGHMKTHCNQMEKFNDQDIVLNAARKKRSVT